MDITPEQYAQALRIVEAYRRRPFVRQPLSPETEALKDAHGGRDDDRSELGRLHGSPW